jgi:hypothetical protein
MNKAFLQLNTSTTKSGLLQLNPTLAQEFKHVTEMFSGLIKTASEGQYEGDEGVEAAEQLPDVQKPPGPEPEAQHVGSKYSDVSKTAAKVCLIHAVLDTGLITCLGTHAPDSAHTRELFFTSWLHIRSAESKQH